jgi:hypothetical protein
LHITGQPNVFVGILQRRKGQKLSRRSERERDAQHKRRHQSPTTCENVLKRSSYNSQDQERTDFGGRRQCMERKGNAFAIERSAVGGITKLAQSTVLRRPEESVRTRSIVRFAMRVPSYSAANRDDEYSVKTNNSSWPRATMSCLAVSAWAC